MLPLDQETLPADCIYVVAGIANLHDLMEQLGEGETRLFVARALRRVESVAKHFNGLVAAQAPDHLIVQTSDRETANRLADSIREKFSQLWVPHEAKVDYFTRVDERMLGQRRSGLHARITYQKNIFVLDDTAPLFTVGRLQSACLSINSERVSRRHATLELRNGLIVLEDSSTNGTFVKFEGEAEAMRVHRAKQEIQRNATLTLGSSADKPGADRITLEIFQGNKA